MAIAKEGNRVPLKQLDVLRPHLGFHKRGGVRRSLLFSGKNDPKANIKIAEDLLTISVENFTQKWNFDPISEVPLPCGRIIWSPLRTEQAMQQASVPTITEDVTETDSVSASEGESVLKMSSERSPSLESDVAQCDEEAALRRPKMASANTGNRLLLRRPRRIVAKSGKLRQMIMTEFGRLQKKPRCRPL